MKVLYLTGATPDTDKATTQQLQSLVPQLEIATTGSTAEALTTLRGQSGAQALLVSSTLSQNETLALIASLRRDRVPVAIVPVVAETQQELFASAIAAGADDVLMMRGQSLVNVNETIARIRQSPHLYPTEQRRRLQVLYAGRDTLVWNLLEQVPFIKAEKTTCGPDGGCSVRVPGASSDSLRCDAVVIDEQPGEAHPLQVLKSVKAQVSDLPVIMLTSAGASDIATAALELGADDTVLKTGIFRRRLIATLRRVHQRLEMTTQAAAIRDREARLRQIVENVPTGIAVVGADGVILAMNLAALRLFGASKPREVVGKDFRSLMAADFREDFAAVLHRVVKGDAAGLEFDSDGVDGSHQKTLLRGVTLERDARGGRAMVAAIAPAPEAHPVNEDVHATELQILKSSIQEAEDRANELERRTADERAAWDTERASLREQLRAVDDDVVAQEQMESRLHALHKTLDHETQAHAEARAAAAARERELEALRAEAAAVKEQQLELETLLAAATDKVQALSGAHDGSRQQFEEERRQLIADRERLEQQVADDQRRATEAHAAAEARVREAEARLAEVQDRLDDATAQVAARERDLSTQVATLDATQGDLRSQLTARQQALEAATEELQAARAARADLERQLAEARTALHVQQETHERDRQQWNQAREALTAKLHATEEAVAERTTREAELNATIDRLNHERNVLAENRERADIERSRHESEWLERLAELTAERDAIARERDAVRQERDSHSETRHLLAQDLSRREAELTARIGELEHERDALIADRDQSQAERARHESEWLDRMAALTAERDAIARERDLNAQERDSHAETRHLLAQDLSRREAELSARIDELERERDTMAAEREQSESERARHEHEWSQRMAMLTIERDTLQREQEHWLDSQRALDEERERAQQLSTAQAVLGEQLAALAAELDRVRDSQAAEQAAWHGRQTALLADLEQARAAAGSGDELRAATAAARQELEDARNTLAGERQDWQQTRTSLEQHLQRVQAALDARESVGAEMKVLQAELTHAREQHEQERQRWAAERASIEAALDAARASAVRPEDLAAFDRLRSDFDQVSQALADERQASADMRARVDAELATLREGVAVRDSLQATVDALQVALRQSESTRHANEFAWTTARQALESRIHTLETSTTSEADGWQRKLSDLEGRLQEAAAAYASEQRAWQVRAASADKTLADTSDELRAARLQQEQERSHWQRQQAELQARLADAERRQDHLKTMTAELAVLKSQHDAALEAVNRERTAHQQDRDTWRTRLASAEADLRSALERQEHDRTIWLRQHAELEARLRAATEREGQIHQLVNEFNAVKAEHANLLETLTRERAAHARERQTIEALRASSENERARRTEVEAAAREASRQADERLAAMEADLAQRRRQLDLEMREANERVQLATAAANDVRRLELERERALAAQDRIVNSDVFGYALMTTSGQVMRCNDTFARIFGYVDAQTLVSQTGHQPFSPMSGRPTLDARLLEERRLRQVDTCLQRIDGRPVRVIESATLLDETIDGRPIVERVLVDVTQETSVEETRAKRLEEIGALAAAMMPEIDTLVGTMHGRMRELRDRLQGREGSEQAVDTLAAVSSHVAALVKQVSAFSRKQARSSEALDINDAIATAEPMLRQLAGRYLDFQIRASATEVLAASREDFEQLLTSLVVFGRDLLPAGGSLVLETRQTNDDAGAEGSTEGFKEPGSVLSLSAAGYGVQLADSAPALQFVASRCGGVLKLGGEPGWLMRVEVLFPRCVQPARGAWNWLVDSM